MVDGGLRPNRDVETIQSTMKHNPKVSVIVVNYNGLPHVDDCISSILRQDYSNFETIFVDNASADGSLEYVRKAFPGLIFVANDSNLGYTGGINSGLARATGEYIAPLNIDTEVAPGWLSSMVDFMEANPLAGAVTPKILIFAERDRINAKGLDVHITGIGFCRRLYQQDDGSLNPEKVPGISGCSYLIRHEVLKQMGGAPEESFMAYDDVIISWLLNLMGFEMYCVPRAVVFHKYIAKTDPDKLFLLEKNRQALLLSSLKPLTLVICLPVFLVIELMIAIYSMIKGKTYIRAKIAAFASLWRERRYIKQKRKQYQGLRKISDFALFRRLNWNLDWVRLFKVVFLPP
ncbi:MAG: glycosyltransferase family 2 protein [Chloroflexi bacterium]|nr:glycosyltransferase family 2 protein [Chloroflexota bacterium]